MYFCDHDTNVSAFPSVNSLQPSAGPQMGGTQITLKGDGFENDQDSFCRFLLVENNYIAVPTRWLSPSEIICTSPTSDNVGLVSIDVTNNALDFSVTSVFFAYRLPESVSFIVPPLGPTLGGTNISVYGRNFVNSDSLACKFGNIIAKANFVNETCIICFSPSLAEGIWIVEVSNNLADFSNNLVDFKVYALIDIEEIYPLSLDRSIRDLKIVSSPFIPPLDIVQCKFDSYIVNGMFSGTFCISYVGSICNLSGFVSIVCPVPYSQLMATRIQLEYSLDGHTFLPTGVSLAVREVTNGTLYIQPTFAFQRYAPF